METLNKRTKENNTANEMREICLKTHNTGCRPTKNGAQRWGRRKGREYPGREPVAILSCKIRGTKARRRLLTNTRTVLNDSQPSTPGLATFGNISQKGNRASLSDMIWFMQ